MSIQDIIKEQPDSNLRKILSNELLKFLPQECVLSQTEELRPFECDGLSSYTQIPLIIASPRSTEEVQKIIRICQTHSVPIVPRGSGTGLSAGALPHPNGLTLNLATMNKLLEIDPDNQTAIVQPGVRNSVVSEEALDFGLFYAPDPSSQSICSIGGNVAENAGGLHCLKYGLTINNVLGLKMVLPNGKIIEVGGKQLQQTGYDLLAMIIGSEGLLGVVTEITLRLIPKQEQVLLAGFPTVRDASQCVAEIIKAGVIPAALEMMDQLTVQAVQQFTDCGYPTNCAAILLCEVDGTKQEIAAQMQQVKSVCLSNNATDFTISNSEKERQKIWLGRKSSFPATAIIAPDYYCLDSVIPRKHIATVLEKIQELSEQYNLQVANVFHAGDGNLHPLILYDASKKGELDQCEELGGKILELCVNYGGTISGEHGIGLEKIGHMCYQFNQNEITQFHSFKEVFDPQKNMNPGKHIPTLHRCAEFGKMHSSHNLQNFSGIPRF